MQILKVNVGDVVYFIVNDDQVVLANPSIGSLRLIQEGMRGEAEKAGLFNEEDVQVFIKENN